MSHPFRTSLTCNCYFVSCSYNPLHLCSCAILSSSVEMSPNFNECSIAFKACYNTTCSSYVYRDSAHNNYASTELSFRITNAGCKSLCGTGNQYYSWKESSTTITTWVLPVLGLLVQLPFESNAFWDTIWVLARWGGRYSFSSRLVVAVYSVCLIDMNHVHQKYSPVW